MREEFQRIYAEVNLDAIRKNVEQMAKNLRQETRIMCVVKADGYGHGAIPIAAELEGMDCVSGFAVATAEEAMALRHRGIGKPVLILGYTFPYSYEKLIREEVRMTVFRYDTLLELSEVSSRAGKHARIHIKVDTGMSRIGIGAKEVGRKMV